MKHPLSETTIAFINDAFEALVQGILDDPESSSEESVIKDLQSIAADLDVDLDTVIRNNGSLFEIERFEKVFSYKVKHVNSYLL